MNRSDFQRLSNARIREAKILFEAGEYSGAYYLAGYAVECALKACFAKTVKRYDFPDKKRVFIHDLTELLDLAELKSKMDSDRKSNPRLDTAWLLVCRWTEQSRYATWTREEAEALIDAIARRKDGVLPWITRLW
jgi:HEPN domain-containing protein